MRNPSYINCLEIERCLCNREGNIILKKCWTLPITTNIHNQTIWQIFQKSLWLDWEAFSTAWYIDTPSSVSSLCVCRVRESDREYIARLTSTFLPFHQQTPTPISKLFTSRQTCFHYHCSLASISLTSAMETWSILMNCSKIDVRLNYKSF